MSGEREEFLASVRTGVARKAMYVCSNPECLRLTGFLTSKGRPRSIAQAAHIQGASDSGPRRSDPVVLPDGIHATRGSEANAIWLCTNCHIKVDGDPESFPSLLLVGWKREHELRVSGLAGLDLEQSLLRLGAARRAHDVACDLLYWLDNHRFMYFDDSCEQPQYVRLALDALRSKIVNLRANFHGEASSLTMALQEVENATMAFFEKLSHIHIDNITITSGDSEFEAFSAQLKEVRWRIKTAIRPIADAEGFKFQRIDFSWVGCRRDK